MLQPVNERILSLIANGNDAPAYGVEKIAANLVLGAKISLNFRLNILRVTAKYFLIFAKT